MADACQRAQAVVHLAAVVGETACAAGANAAWDINVGGTLRALGAAESANHARFIYVSTCSNYGVSSPDALADEDAPLRPLGIYARSKVEAEQAVLSHNGKLARVGLRFGTICGLSSRMRFDLLINEMARAAVLGDVISVFAPEAWRPYLHIRDAASAIEWALGDTAVTGQVFYVVGENHQKKGLVEIVRRHFPDARVEITSRVPDLRDYRVSAERLARVGGFHACRTVEQALVEVAAAVRSEAFRNPRWEGWAAAPGASD